MNNLGGYLVRRVLGALAVAAAFGLLTWFNQAHAYSASSQCQYFWTGAGGNQTTIGAAESFVLAAFPTYDPTVWYSSTPGTWTAASAPTCPTTPGTYNSAYVVMSKPSSPDVYSGSMNAYRTPLTCPSGGTLSGSTCTCPSGYTDTGSACVAGTPTSCPGAQKLVGGSCICESFAGTQGALPDLSPIPTFWEYGITKTAWSSAPATVSGCMDSCAVIGYKNGWVSGSGFYNTKQTGATCSGTTRPSVPSASGSGDASSDEAKCLNNGGAPGQVNGVFTCLNKQDATENVKNGKESTNTSTTVNPDGSRTETNTTQTPTTTCNAGACTTTISTTTIVNTFNPAGTLTGTTTTTTTNTNPGGSGSGGSGGNGGTCDPSKQQCGDGSSFGGSCSAGFVCDGDAIQCAIAREQHIRFCQVLDESTAGATKGDAATWYAANSAGEGIEGDDFHQTGELPTLDNTRHIGAAGLSDLTVEVQGQSLTIPFSNLNTVLAYLGNILMAIALIIAARIFHKGATA